MRRTHYASLPERLLYALITLILVVCAICGIGGCKKTDKPIVTDWAQICVHGDVPVRTSDESCDTAPDRFHWLYVHQRAMGFIPLAGVGQNVDDGRIDGGLVATTARPSDALIGRVPYNGGLGTIQP